jgi:hypothetical protein
MKKAKIIILAGQSNAVGVGHVKFLSKHFPIDRIKKWLDGYPNVRINYFSHDKKSDGFIDTTVGCTEVSKYTTGPELGIADALDTKYPDEKFFIVKCAFGGTSLYRDWLSPSCDGYDAGSFADQYEHMIRSLEAGMPIRASWCYNELVKITDESIKTLLAREYSPEIISFCWMQGEADACAEETTRQYIKRYDAMLNDFKKAFSEYTANCVFADAGISEIWPLYKELNEEKRKYAEKSENRAYIDTIAAGLTTSNEPEEPDIYHYDSDCVIKLGHLFADTIKP